MQVISLEAFCAWLCAHEHEVVGRSGTWFQGPLARWLSDLLGGVYGVDGSGVLGCVLVAAVAALGGAL
jgi:hypothetical protein